MSGVKFLRTHAYYNYMLCVGRVYYCCRLSYGWTKPSHYKLLAQIEIEIEHIVVVGVELQV